MNKINKVVVLTGFNEYGFYHYNPSSEIVSFFKEKEINGFRIKTLDLPVSLRAVKILENVLDRTRPPIVISTGLSPRARKIIVELIASNIVHYPDYPDEDRYNPSLEYISTEKTLMAIPSTLPLNRIKEKCIDRKQLPITFGVSIGTYLCGATAFTVHRYAQITKSIGGFIHIPPSTDFAMRHRLPLTNSLPLSLMIETLECILRVSIDSVRSRY